MRADGREEIALLHEEFTAIYSGWIIFLLYSLHVVCSIDWTFHNLTCYPCPLYQRPIWITSRWYLSIHCFVYFFTSYPTLHCMAHYDGALNCFGHLLNEQWCMCRSGWKRWWNRSYRLNIFLFSWQNIKYCNMQQMNYRSAILIVYSLLDPLNFS